jgi:hypothetical protein
VAKSAAEAKGPVKPEPTGYLAWSRDPAVGLFAVLPLWLCYEGLRWSLTPDERNGAEALLLDALGLLGRGGMRLLSAVFLLCVVAAAVSLVRRRIPWLRVAMMSALEGTVYGLLLGPLSGALAESAHRWLAAGLTGERLGAQLTGALGAGIFEELVFRLALMSVLVWLGLKAAAAFGLPRAAAAVPAVLISALLFSAFHHMWPGGEKFTTGVFLFRAMAGLLLGVLMLFRGYGVCVYTHAMYDVHYYLSGH